MSRVLLFLALLGGLASPAFAVRVLLVTDNNGSLTSQESLRKSQFEAWGHTVTTVWEEESQANIDAAMASVDVVWITEECNANNVGYKFRTATVGVVSGERALDNEMGFATSNGSDWTENEIQIVDTSHPITAGFSTGWTTITSSNQSLSFTQGTEASGAQALASYSGAYDLIAMESGSTLANAYSGNSTATARRVRLPWGGNSFNWSALNSNGLLIAQRALDWASGIGPELVGHWDLNESSGSVAADDSARGNDGAYTGSPTLGQTGIRSTAVAFNGSNQYVEVPADTSLDTTDVSLAAWVYLPTVSSGWQTIVEHGRSTDNWYGLWKSANADVFHFRWGNNGSLNRIDSNTTVTAGKWHHIVGVYDSSTNEARLYIDGQLDRTVISDATPTSVSSVLRIGANASGAEFFPGTIDDVRVYNYAITEETVATLYGLVGHWRLDESTGSTAADSSLNDNDGAHGSGVTAGVAGPNSQYAAEYDGGNNFTEVAHGGDWNTIDNQFSLATWVKIDAGSDTHGLIIWDDVSTPYALLIDSSNRPSMRINWSSAGSVSHTAAVSLTVGQWHHVAVTYDGSTVRFYIDGSQDANTLSTSTTVNTSSSEMQIGGDDGSVYDLTGALHDARVYNRALLADEVADLADTGSVIGLIAHWKLDETSGATAVDSTGNGFDGSYDNGVTLGESGVRSGAARFDGSNDIVTVSGGSALNLTGSISVGCWAKSDSSTWNSTGMLVSKRNQFIIHPSAGNTTVTFYARLDGAWRSVSVDAGTIDRWRQYVGVWDEDAGQLRLYIDGELKGTRSVGTGADVDSDTGDLLIGGDDGFSSRRFAGVMDDVVLYDRVMTDAEIAGHFGRVGHWRLDETSGSSASDSSGYGVDLTASTAPSWTATGVRSGAADVSAGSTLQSAGGEYATIDEAFSLACWFKLDQDATDLTSNNFLVRCIDIGTDGFDLLIGSASDVLRVRKYQGATDGTVTAAASGFRAGRWRQAIATYDGAALVLYVDGEQVATVADADGFTPPAGRLQIGTQLTGSIDDVVLYNRAMLPEEIAEHYGLVGHWKLDEASGSVAADSTPLGNDGAYENGATLGEEGVRGAAPAFDGSNDHVSIAGNETLDATEGVAVAAWAKSDSATWSNYPSLLCKRNQVILTGSPSTTNVVLYVYRDGAGWVSLSADAEDVDRWRQYAGSYDAGSGVMELYVDGELIASQNLGAGTSLASDTTSLSIAYDEASAGRYFAGRVDDVRLYNRRLLASELAEHYGLVGRWRMEEVSGVTVADSSGVGNSGSLAGSASWSSDAKEGSGSLELDGADYVEIPGLVVDDPSDGVTISGWAKLTTADTGGAELISLGDHFAIRLDDGSLGANGIAYNGGGWTHVENGTLYEGSGWRHFAFTYSGATDEAKFFVDGVLRATKSVPGGLQASGLGANTRIGTHGNGETTRSFTGLLDDVRVYNRAISREEARALFYGQVVEGIRIISWVEVANP